MSCHITVTQPQYEINYFHLYELTDVIIGKYLILTKPKFYLLIQKKIKAILNFRHMYLHFRLLQDH